MTRLSAVPSCKTVTFCSNAPAGPRSESEIVQEAIAQYLGQVDVNSVASLNRRVAALERQYQKLVKLV
jgi:uncharacterized small protein (DUF1192 family)